MLRFITARNIIGTSEEKKMGKRKGLLLNLFNYIELSANVV